MQLRDISLSTKGIRRGSLNRCTLPLQWYTEGIRDVAGGKNNWKRVGPECVADSKSLLGCGPSIRDGLDDPLLKAHVDDEPRFTPLTCPASAEFCICSTMNTNFKRTNSRKENQPIFPFLIRFYTDLDWRDP